MENNQTDELAEYKRNKKEAGSTKKYVNIVGILSYHLWNCNNIHNSKYDDAVYDDERAYG